MKKYWYILVYCLIALCDVAHSYVLINYEWNKNDYDKTRPLTIYVKTSGAPSGFLTAIKNASKAWTGVPNADFSFNIQTISSGQADPSDGVNTVLYDPTDPRCIADPDLLAQTTTKSTNGLAQDSDIVFCHQKLAFHANAQEYDLESVALHEMGHLLGLNHPPQLHLSAMEDGLMLGEKLVLLQDDANGMAFIYDGRPPTVSLVDGKGKSIANNGWTNTNSIVVKSQDDPRGLRQIDFANYPSGTPIDSQLFQGTTDQVTKQFNIPNDGKYYVFSIDRRNNYVSPMFGADKVLPALQILNEFGTPLSPPNLDVNKIQIESQDLDSGVDEIRIINLNTGVTYDLSLHQGTTDQIHTSHSNIPDGSYEVHSKDRAGNDSKIQFKICMSEDCDGGGDDDDNDGCPPHYHPNGNLCDPDSCSIPIGPQGLGGAIQAQSFNNLCPSVCPGTGQPPNPDGTCTQPCPAGYHPVAGGLCRPDTCPTPPCPDICPDGQAPDSSGTCPANCPTGMVKSVLGQCVDPSTDSDHDGTPDYLDYYPATPDRKRPD